MATSLQDQIAAAVSSFKDPRTMKMPVSNTDEFRASSPTYFPLSGRPVQTTPYPALDRSKPMSVNYWPQYGANDPSGGVPYLAAPMPAQTGTGNLPGMGAYAQYGATPNTGGDPNRLSPSQLPFINKPPLDITVRGGNPTLAASIPMPRARPGLNIQPFGDQGNLMDPGNAGYVDPMAAYAPQPAPSPAASAINGLSPLSASERINQPMPGQPAPYNSPRDMSRAQMYDATNAAAAEAARTRDRSGFGTDGYVRNAAGDVIGRNANFQGMTPSQQYDFINGNFDPVAGVMQDDSWKAPSSSSSSNKQYRDFGFGSEREMTSAIEQYMNANGVDYGAASKAVMGPRRPNFGSTGGGQRPVTAGPTASPRIGGTASNMQRPVTSGPMIAPVTGGIMTPARARPRTSGPIMRRA